METRRDETDAEQHDRNWADQVAAAVVLVFFVSAWVVLPLSLLRRGTGAP